MPDWGPDVAVGVVVAFVGLAEVVTGNGTGPGLPRLGFIAILAIAAGGFRRYPGVALGLLWAAALVQVTNHQPWMLAEASVGVVAFGTARYGRLVTVWLSALSVPLVVLLSAFYWFGSMDPLLLARAIRNGQVPLDLVRGSLPAFVLVLVLPWGAGLAARLVVRSRESEAAAEASRREAEERREAAELARSQAEQIAGLRERQSQLARDVHDVVGHSLAVILAQAESAQYLDDLDTGAMRQVMGNVADSARRSLQDVRQVLAEGTSGGPAAPVRHDDLVDLVAAVRDAGNDLRLSIVGTPLPLPPERALVAYRVMQEMLTNALKHGLRGRPVEVELHWADPWQDSELRMEVTNEVEPWDPAATQPVPAPGDGTRLGLDSMRRRLESVGGRLDVRRRGETADATYAVTAWLPIRSEAPR